MSKFYLPKELDCHHTIFTTNVLPSQVTQSDLINISRNKNHYFLQFNFRNSVSLPHQGFKIHVSCTLHSYQRVLDSVFTLCKSNGITFKYISNKDMIIKNLSGHGSLWSSGKFITIYPQNSVEFRNIIEKLYLYDMLGFIDKKFKVENRKIVSYKITIKSVYLSPYLYDGISGILDIYLLIKEKFGNDDYCSAAKSLAYQLLFATMPKSLSLNRGLAGIVYVLIRYRNIYQDTFFDYYIKVMLNCFKYYMYKWDDNVYTVDPTFKKATANFKDGNEGVIFVLREALTIY